MPQEGGHGFRTPVGLAANQQCENALPKVPPAASRSSDTAGHYGRLTEEQFQGHCRIVGTILNQRQHEVRASSWDNALGGYGGPGSTAREVTSVHDDPPDSLRIHGGLDHRVADWTPNRAWGPYPLSNTPGPMPVNTTNILGFQVDPRVVLQHHDSDFVRMSALAGGNFTRMMLNDNG